MKIMVTGGCGFIASHVIKALLDADHSVVNLDKLDYCSSLHTSQLKHARYKFIQGNILFLEELRNIFSEEEIDVVMHFAASTHVDNSFDNSLNFTFNNVVGTHNMLICAKEFNVKKFIHVSTDEVRGESEKIMEDRIFSPTNPYAASKAGAELLASSYETSYNLPLIITRCNNVYGPGQYPEKLIPKFIHLLLEGRKCTIHGNGENQRNYLYVSDVVDAFLTVLDKGQVGKIYSFCSEDCLSNFEVYSSLCRLLDKDEKENVSFVKDRPFNDKRYHMSDMEIKALGWKPKVSFAQGLEKTVAWYKENLEKQVWVMFP